VIDTIKKYLKTNPIIRKYLRRHKNGINLKSSYHKKISGSGNKLILDNSALFISCNFDIKGNNNSILVKESVIFRNTTFYIRGNNHNVIIESGVQFNRGGEIWIEDTNGTLLIGKNSTFENVHLAVSEPYSKIKIGEECMFAYDIDIRTGDSHSILDLNTLKRINYAKNIVIGNHVWVASHVSILKGSQLADGSIVATRSVVTKEFSSKNVLLIGSPAKVQKENITWDRQRIYQHQVNDKL
jgi:acetyltransferase-like isoleucine patch superfamily enzyme